MSGTGCPRPEALTRALSAGAVVSEEIQRHLLRCPSCQRERAAQEELARLGRALPWDAPDRAHRDAVRARLLQAAAAVTTQRPAPRRAPWALAAAAAILVAFGLGLRWRAPGPSSTPVAQAGRHGTVRALGAARYLEGGTPQDEIVRLAEGTLLVEVSPLAPGERFRVLTGDGEVEVRGTMFEVHAARDQLRSVRVLHGKVEVRPGRRPAVLLGTDERWPADVPPEADGGAAPDAPPTVVAAPPTPAGGAAPAPGTATAPRPHAKEGAPASPRPRPAHAAPTRLAAIPVPAAPAEAPRPTDTPAERAFSEGFDALRAGQYGPAADAFARAADAAPTGPLAEDARYWRAVATARAGRPEEAMKALRDFLSRHPRSTRTGEASSILGWLLFDAGQIEEAERRFLDAEKDRSQAVQRSAREGLAATAARRERRP